MSKGNLLFNLLLLCSSTLLEGTSIRIYNSIAEVSNRYLVPRGSTVVLVCTETPTPQQVDYQWTCPNSPCDGQYRKVYGNVLVVVATTATSGVYRCRPTPGSAATRTLTVQRSLVADQLAIYNNGRLLLQNTLFTSPQQIPNGLTCTRSWGSSYVPRFRREGDSTTKGTQTSLSTIVQTVSLQPNGRYWCNAGEVKRAFFIYVNNINAILPTPQVSVESTTTDQQLHLLLTTPPPYNSGRFILRYDCTLGEADIEVEYRRADPGVNSNTVVTRNRSCFVVGEISRVTVWFVSGENISTTPAVVGVNGANITVTPTKATETITSPPTPTPTTEHSATSLSSTTTTTTITTTTTTTTATITPTPTMSGTANLTAVIDGYTLNSTLTSPATLPLGRTALLVCRVSGIPHGQQPSYQWTCPNQPCLQTGYAGRKIDNNIIAINTTSASDGGTYTCTFTAGGMEGRQDFRISVAGGAVVHSYGRLIVHEEVITNKRQLQPPNDDTGDGRIECTISGGRSRFSFTQYRVDSGNIGKATAVIPREDFTNFNNIEGSCGNAYLYLFLKKTDGFPQVRSLTLSTASTQSITATMEFTYDSTNGIGGVITGYHRLDLGHEMVGQFHNNHLRTTVTFSALVPGARYRITTWGLGRGRNRKRGSAPAVLEVTTQQSVPSPPRALTITRVFEDGIELNWLPPRETNGDIQHYIIRYTLENGTAEQEITNTDNTNYYNLTRLEEGQTYYNITVESVNLAHTSARSNTIGSYTHRQGSLNTPTIQSVPIVGFMVDRAKYPEGARVNLTVSRTGHVANPLSFSVRAKTRFRSARESDYDLETTAVVFSQVKSDYEEQNVTVLLINDGLKEIVQEYFILSLHLEQGLSVVYSNQYCFVIIEDVNYVRTCSVVDIREAPFKSLKCTYTDKE